MGRDSPEPRVVPTEPAVAGTTPAPVLHPSPGIAALFAGLAAQREQRVLDLGAASGVNLAVYARFGRSVRVVDLCRGTRQGPPTAVPPSPGDRLAALLPAADGPYGVILVWDLLDYLDAPASRTLVARLVGCAEAGTRLFAMTAEGPQMPELPGRFEIVDGEHLLYRPATAAMRAGPRLAPAEVERRVAPFRVERSIVLRHGVREYVAVLPREPS
jgi:hypothetical protein